VPPLPYFLINHASRRPAVTSLTLQPPESVVVGDMFQVLVFVGLSSTAPLANYPVTLSITPSSLGQLTESVQTFIRRLSGQPVVESDAWQDPVLDTESLSATSDASGVAQFRVRIVAAIPGEYTLSFAVKGLGTIKSTPFLVQVSVVCTILSCNVVAVSVTDAVCISFCLNLDVLMCGSVCLFTWGVAVCGCWFWSERNLHCHHL
jgi:hypothetical protein